MSVLGSLINVGCQDCKRSGHFCQAQMWEDCEAEDDGIVLKFRKPVCLRCADGEPCFYETAKGIGSPRHLEDELDIFQVPELTDQDHAFVAALSDGGEPSDWVRKADAEVRAAILVDLEMMTNREIAWKHKVASKYVMNLRYNERARKRSLGIKEKQRELVEKMVGGELVRISPMASMGAELLGR